MGGGGAHSREVPAGREAPSLALGGGLGPGEGTGEPSVLCAHSGSPTRSRTLTPWAMPARAGAVR